MSIEAKPRALVVYYTFSQQTGRVADVMAEALAAQGYEVTKAAIEFTDPHWAKRFSARSDAVSRAADPDDLVSPADAEDRRDPHPG